MNELGAEHELETKTVKLGKLLASIRRELLAKPKKAALLVLLLAAAGWFWWPIVGKIFGKRPPAAAPKAASAVGAAAPAPAVVPVADESQAPRVRWSEVAAARRLDPLTRPALFDPDWPQPFKVTARPQESAGPADAAGHASALLTPAEAGLVLESIVYGKEQRAVVINGEMYHEGSYVVVAAAAGPPLHFHLVQIKPSSVILARYGKPFKLEFPKPRLVRSGGPQ